MTEAEVLEILRYIADSDEKCAMDVMYAMTLLSTNVNNMLESIKNSMVDHLAENRFDDLNRLTVFLKNITMLGNQVETCIDTLVKKSPNAQKASAEIKPKMADIQNQISVEKSIAANPHKYIDYSCYEVDGFEKHSLDEDFVYSKIAKIEFENKIYAVDNWKEALMKLCSILYKKNPNKMKSFVSSPEYTRKKFKYFDTHPLYAENNRPRTTLLEGTNIYVHTNLSANDITKLIKQLLCSYEYKPADFFIFLRADYKELHNKEIKQ